MSRHPQGSYASGSRGDSRRTRKSAERRPSLRLPHDEQAEAAVLGAIILNNDALHEVVAVLDDEAFYVPRWRSVFRAMVTLSEQGLAIDSVTLEHQLRASDELGLVGGLEDLSRLTDHYATSHHVLHHAELVRRSAVVRKMMLTGQRIVEDGLDGVEDFDAYIDDAEREVLEVNQHGRHASYVPTRDLIVGVFEQLSERAKAKNPVTGVATSFTKLDELTGGLQPGDLIILAARPSMGKTALALNIAQAASVTQAKHWPLPEEQRPKRVPVLFFSLEMSSGQLVERLLCAEARVDSQKIRAGRMLEHEFRGLVQAAERVRLAPLFIDDSGSPTILEIRARARRFRHDRQLFPPNGAETDKKPGGLIVVDYLQLCRGGKRRYDSREQEISEISRGLKAIAKEVQLPVLALSQLNRSVDSRSDHRPQLSDLRESGAIEQDADVILFVYREARYITDEQERKEVERNAEVIIGKQRNGPTGVVHLIFRGEYTRFENPAYEGGYS